MKTIVTLVAVAFVAPAVAHADHVQFGDARTRVAAETSPDPAEEMPAMPMMDTEPPARETTIFGLPKNVGPGDRVLRTVIGLGLAGLGAYGLATDEMSGTTSGILLGVSSIPLATAATGYCPLYQVIGIERSF